MKSDGNSGLCRIQASAGSGKTWELTRRFLDPGGHSWGDIIAITFTNAAATEMRERVLWRLKNAALGTPDAGVPFSREEARRWVDAVLRDMSSLNIRTIDSLLHLIVRSAPLGPRPRPAAGFRASLCHGRGARAVL